MLEKRLSACDIPGRKSSSFLSSYLSVQSPSPDTSCTPSPRDSRRLGDEEFVYLQNEDDFTQVFQIRNLDTGEVLDLRNECQSSFPEQLAALLSQSSPRRWRSFMYWLHRAQRCKTLGQVWLACCANDLSTVKELIDNADFNPAARTTHDWTMLHVAAAAGAMDVCAYLISYFPELDINCRSCSHQTPLHLASQSGFLGTVKVLYRANADIDAVDALGNTPLHYACLHSRESVARYLLSRGADAAAANNRGRLAADLATAWEVRRRLNEGSDNYARVWTEGVLRRCAREDAVARLLAQRPCCVFRPLPEASYQDFVPVRFIGRGGFGEVYIVKEVKSGHFFAVKSMKKSRLLKEALLSYALTERNVLIACSGHPFIAQLHCAFQTPTRLLLAMEYYPNGDLRQLLAAENKLTENVAKRYAAEMLLALDFLHRKEIIYRDIKPENVVFDSEGHIRLIDFGLSKEDFPAGNLTSSFCGTLNYLAPEMIKSKPHDHSLDWYMFGCLLYEMLVGKPPFVARHAKDVVRLIESGNVVFPATMSSEAMDLIQGLMHPDPAKRLGARGATRVKEHRFFWGVDWKQVQDRRVTGEPHPPKLLRLSSIVPQIKVYGDLKKPCRYISGWTYTRPS